MIHGVDFTDSASKHVLSLESKLCADDGDVLIHVTCLCGWDSGWRGQADTHQEASQHLTQPGETEPDSDTSTHYATEGR